MSRYTRQEVAQRAGVPLDKLAAAVRDGALSLSFMDVTAFDETEAAWWNSEVVTPLLASGTSKAGMLQAQADLGSRMANFTEQALLAVYHGQQEHAWSQGSSSSSRARWKRPACTAG